MKKALLLFVFVLIIAPGVIGQTMKLNENFSYGATGDVDLVTLTSDWVRHSGAVGPVYKTTSLTYATYASSGIGGSLWFTKGGSGVNDGDIHRKFDSVTTTGNVFVSFLVKLDSATATGDYFFHFAPKTIGTTFRGRVYAKNFSTGFVFGLSKTGTPTVYDSTVTFNFGQTYLVVMKYAFNTTATNDDLVTMYVYTSGVPMTEPGTPALTISALGAGVTNDPTDIGSVAVRQGNNTPTGYVDGIRISTIWGEAPVPVELSSFAASVNGSTVNLRWSTATETNNRGFEVQKSSDKSSWNTIGFVNGTGNSSAPKNYSYADKNNTTGTVYYRLRQVDFDGTSKNFDAITVNVSAPVSFALNQNYPNPFNPSTVISYSVPNETRVELSVYTLTGQLVRTLVNQVQAAGTYNVPFNASDLTSGLYVYQLKAAGSVMTRKMTLIK